MNLSISAIDLGFLYTKGIINGKRVIIKSVVGDSKPQRFSDLDFGMKETDHLQCKIGVENFFVSDLAIDQSDSIFHSLKDDRFNNDATDVLVKTVFGLGFGNDHVESVIVSGLPVSHYATYKSDIANLFLGPGTKIHNFEIRENNKLIRGSVKLVDGKFIPQPFGAQLDRILNDKGEIEDKELARKVVAVIDPGFGTTDVYVSDALTPVEKLTFSTRTAMNHAYRLIANKIEEQFGVFLQLHEIESIVRKGEFRNRGKIYDMRKVMEWAYKSTAQQLVAEITNKWKYIHEIDHILLAGGGGLALSKWILPEFPNIELLEDSQWAVVKGYYKWGVRHFGR
jgi:plasmid segregation protein ParM